ncbi:PilZ domain-containing protein [Cyanobium sp. ATX 6F1]|uniref:PilZ domain-containing protein n=1 Tax=unclassified Cyanobium TaxID=2627006 RepID=UPI0020CE17FD|nr:PilZ domain-containing protein [Cyanobium sp. ATX 6F1]MCP9916020.1 PilZ domain-containing protein [Cyanobium sp. ATX 6F1]
MTDSSQRHPRRHKRNPMPSSVGLAYEFHLQRGGVHHGEVWDLSAGGACLTLPGRKLIQIDSPGLLFIQHPFQHEGVKLLAHACWTQSSSSITFFGLVFSEGPLKKGTFLDDYMRGSWVDRMAVRQLDQAA